MHRILHSRYGSVVLLLLAVGVFAGCGSSGPKRYKVSGTVKYKDAPIPSGSISFLSEETGALVAGTTITDGKYEIPQPGGLLVGKYKVSVSYPDPKGAAPAPKEGEPPGASREVKETLPAKYNRDTELRAEVKADGANEFPFDLK